MRPVALATSLAVHAAVLCAAWGLRPAVPTGRPGTSGELGPTVSLLASAEMPAAPLEEDAAPQSEGEVLPPVADIAAPDAKVAELAELDAAAAIARTAPDQTVEKGVSSPRRHLRRTSRPGGGVSALGNGGGGGAGAYVAPRYRMCPPPPYPAAARAAKLQGGALLLVEVDTQGSVVKVTIRRSTGSSLLDEAAINGVRRWKFEPARVGERIVAASVEVPVRFVFQG